MILIGKPSLEIRAQAELELRRRQKERSASCFMCEIESLVDQTYSSVPDADKVCDHSREQQEIESRFTQNLIADIELVYEDSGSSRPETSGAH